LGKFEIVKAISNFCLFNKKEYLTQKDISKALKNMGVIFREDYINKNLRDMRKDNIIELKDKNTFRKEYRINKENCPYKL